MLKQAELWQHIPITRNPPCIRKLSALFFFFILYVWLARAGYSSSISSSGWAPRASRSSFRRRLPPHRRPGPPVVLPVPCRTSWWRRRRGIHIHQPGLELYGCSCRRLRQRKPMESPALYLLLLGCLLGCASRWVTISAAVVLALLWLSSPSAHSSPGTASLVAAAASSTLALEALPQVPSSSLLEPARPPPRASPGEAPADQTGPPLPETASLDPSTVSLLLHSSFWLSSRRAQ